MITVHTAAEDAQISALQALGIYTVTDLCRYADAHGAKPADILRTANV
ncbi:hypothetical protein [Arthrobacter zhaoxinii]|nr:hypothetical protein [Arthrobacter zhaoxinii]MCQ1999535.1 hypothetical protein [Arthrobacter zhaoxinii]